MRKMELHSRPAGPRAQVRMAAGIRQPPEQDKPHPPPAKDHVAHGGTVKCGGRAGKETRTTTQDYFFPKCAVTFTGGAGRAKGAKGKL